MMLDFNKLDTNNDGHLSRAEWAAQFGSEEGFDACDVNGDGKV